MNASKFNVLSRKEKKTYNIPEKKITEIAKTHNLVNSTLVAPNNVEDDFREY